MTALDAQVLGTPVLLSCRSVDGSPRYDLPGTWLERRAGFEVFWRPAPALVIHHQKQETIARGAEFVLIAPDRPYVISISMDDGGLPVEAYININLPPERTEQGWSWRDLELDLRALRQYTGRWSTYVLDIEEFQAAHYDAALSVVATKGLLEARLLVASRNFPFDTEGQEWFGSLWRNAAAPMP